jgi:glycosyltransferase involved in cell wall biosynthesis
MISVCITIKDRSRIVHGDKVLLSFPNCVRSIAESFEPGEAELVVADWESTDWPIVEWLREYSSHLPPCIQFLNGEFSRGRGRNAAAERASGETLFFLDADMLINRSVVVQCLAAVLKKHAVFPMCRAYKEDGSLRSKCWSAGYGNCMLAKSVWARTKWEERVEWGREDVSFCQAVSKLVPIERPAIDGFLHQWHPSNDRRPVPRRLQA